MISPLELDRLAVRVERLVQTVTHGWDPGDEMEFRKALPPMGTMESRPWQLPSPKMLRGMSRSIQTGEAQPDQHVAELVRNANTVCMRMEGLIRDNDPRNPRRMIRDMARGKFPMTASVERVAERFLKR